MRWYLIMIPFLSLFLYSGFKLELYQEKLDDIEPVVINSLYSATNIDALRYYQSNIVDEEKLKLQLVKFIALESSISTDTTLKYKITSYNPLTIDVAIATSALDSDIEVRRSFILDTTI